MNQPMEKLAPNAMANDQGDLFYPDSLDEAIWFTTEHRAYPMIPAVFPFPSIVSVTIGKSQPIASDEDKPQVITVPPMLKGGKPLTFVLVPAEQYLDMFEDRLTLRALEAAGVDNWDGYGGGGFSRIEERVDRERTRLGI